MKLLASVLSVAAADYACCPYDDFGVPDSVCTDVLSEKSPFSPLDASTTLLPQESYACKAWEANAGAASESHKGTSTVQNDWGSCGFQRHFPWYHTKAGDTTDNLHKIGLWTSGVANYKVLATGGSFGVNTDPTDPNATNGWNMLSLTRGSFSGTVDPDPTIKEGTKPVVGEVHLGAVCKLFVPVQKNWIRQVSVAGVHVNNARIAMGAHQAFSTEMNAAVVGNFAGTVGGSHTASYHAGTAYCFSVVNIAEFMTNRQNNIANANVAGEDETARGTGGTGKEWFADDVGFKYDDSTGAASVANFGTIWPGYDQGTKFNNLKGTPGVKNSGQHKVNMGSNFDVVVHFDTAWCAAHWNIVDMQKADDHGFGETSGNAVPSPNDKMQNLRSWNGGPGPAFGTKEALMDAWDKRLQGDVGSCGLCYDKNDGLDRGPGNAGVSACNPNTVLGFTKTLVATQASNSEKMDDNFGFNYNANAPGACTNLNTYTSGTKRWPNAGAWAAFYSFITCARSDYMIYGPATRNLRKVNVNILGGTADGTHLDEDTGAEGAEAFQDGTHDKTNESGVGNNDNRMVVVGGWHQDYRHGVGACVRFNLRQVGNNVEYCADGDEEDFNAKTHTANYNPTGDTSEWSQNGPKRCTWNWNYKTTINANSYDAEAWFDSVDPLHKQVWSTGEKFIDEPHPGVVSAQAQNYAVNVALGALTDTLYIKLLLQDNRPSKINGVTVSAASYVGPNKLEMDAALSGNSGYLTVESGPNQFDAADTASSRTNAAAEVKLFDTTTGGTWAQISLTCRRGTSPSTDRSDFPDCFFGDEIHGQWVWDTTDILKDLEAASGTSLWKFWAMIDDNLTY